MQITWDVTFRSQDHPSPHTHAHMALHHSEARRPHSFTQANSENKGAVKSPFTSAETEGEEPGVPVASRVISPKTSLHPKEFKSHG